MTNVYSMNYDGTSLLKLADAGEKPVWSPDGQRIAFISTASGDSGALYVVDANATNMRRISLNPEKQNPVDFAWSPDGTFLVYATFAGKELYVVSPDGITHKTLRSSLRLGLAYAWSPDGLKIAAPGVGALTIRDLNTENRTIVVKQTPRKLDWAPDGTKLLYRLDDGYYVVKADGSDPRKVLPVSKSERLAGCGRMDSIVGWLGVRRLLGAVARPE